MAWYPPPKKKKKRKSKKKKKQFLLLDFQNSVWYTYLRSFKLAHWSQKEPNTNCISASILKRYKRKALPFSTLKNLPPRASLLCCILKANKDSKYLMITTASNCKGSGKRMTRIDTRCRYFTRYIVDYGKTWYLVRTI